jgi:hypothetical protein
MKKIYFFFLISVILLLNFTCQRINPSIYLVLTKEDFENCIDVSDFNSTHDENYDEYELDVISRQLFTDVYVEFRGQSLGYWQLPCSIPLDPDYAGINNVRITPCVRVVRATLATQKYPFVSPIEWRIENVKAGETYRLPKPTLKYLPSVDFPILETFVQSINFTPRDSVFTTPIEIYDDGAGRKIGRIALEDSVIYFDVVANEYTKLFGQFETQFWEISYRIDNGIMYTHLNYKDSPLGITYQPLNWYPSTISVTGNNWKKAYIDITEQVRMASNGAQQLSVRLQITGLKDDELRNAYFYFEYIRLITIESSNY